MINIMIFSRENIMIFMNIYIKTVFYDLFTYLLSYVATRW